MSILTIAALMLATITAASAQSQTTFRDASGRTTGTATTDSNGTEDVPRQLRPHDWHRHVATAMTLSLMGSLRPAAVTLALSEAVSSRVTWTSSADGSDEQMFGAE